MIASIPIATSVFSSAQRDFKSVSRSRKMLDCGAQDEIIEFSCVSLALPVGVILFSLRRYDAKHSGSCGGDEVMYVGRKMGYTVG